MFVVEVGKKARPLSPGSNYPSTKNIQTQRNGFGTWLSKFETVGKGKKSKYGMPIFLPNGNVRLLTANHTSKLLRPVSERMIFVRAGWSWRWFYLHG